MYNLPYCVAYVINCKRLTHKQAKLATQILIHLPMLLESSSELSSLTHEQRLKKNRARTQEIEDQHPGRHDANSNARTPHTRDTDTKHTRHGHKHHGVVYSNICLLGARWRTSHPRP
jgi:hypothetical protein